MARVHWDFALLKARRKTGRSADLKRSAHPSGVRTAAPRIDCRRSLLRCAFSRSCRSLVHWRCIWCWSRCRYRRGCRRCFRGRSFLLLRSVRRAARLRLHYDHFLRFRFFAFEIGDAATALDDFIGLLAHRNSWIAEKGERVPRGKRRMWSMCFGSPEARESGAVPISAHRECPAWRNRGETARFASSKPCKTAVAINPNPALTHRSAASIFAALFLRHFFSCFIFFSSRQGSGGRRERAC